jgi:pimeloyl-ACP methyl ester carboxylesterase
MSINYIEKHYYSLNSTGFHRIVYSDWGVPEAHPVVCVHGLTGNGHDFDFLAEALVEKGYRFIAVDLPGRGRSDFLSNPADYNYNQYCHDLTALLAHLGLSEPGSIDWLGVSLGGLLGIKLAGMENSPIRRLIINDVGPVVPQEALDFIHQVISQVYTFNTVKDLEQRMRETRGITWGPVTDEQWKHMAEHNARALEDGQITYAYDPEIAVVFEGEPIGDADLWTYWDRIVCPVLLIQGGKSMLLTDEIVEDMNIRGPGQDMDLVIFEDCGHVPSLMAPEHISVIEQWLDATQR